MLAAYGLDEASLKARFDKPVQDMTEEDRVLVRRWRGRAMAGRDFNLTHYRNYLAIDRAWQNSFQACPAELISMLKEMVEAGNEEDAVSVVEQWRMPYLLVPVLDPKTGNPINGKKMISMPAIHNVVLAIARSYSMMRISRIVNERINIPFFKYESAYSTDLNRLKCDVITQEIDRKSRDFGYPEVFKMAQQCAVKYGQQFMFIQEEWYREDDVTLQGTRIGREGLRHCVPHPNKTYYDLDWPTWTLNKDSGTRYVGYWRTQSFGSIRLNTKYWNRDRIVASRKFGSAEWTTYFQTTGQCRMAMPYGLSTNITTQNDRETMIDNRLMTHEQDSMPVWVTEHFEKVNLRSDFNNENLPDIDVWFRVVMASDDTPIYVAALPGPPATVWLYEPDHNQAIQEGMMLQVMPFQTHVANLMSQGNRTLSDNLVSVNLYNTDAIDPAIVDAELRNPNGARFRKTWWWPFSFKQLKRADIKGADDLFKPVVFPQKDITLHLQMIGQLLAMLERVVGMSAQEVGSYATHEQSAEEQKNIHQATSQRYEYVAGWADFAIESWKSQLYRYLMAYGQMNAIAEIDPALAEQAAQLGVTPDPAGKKMLVSVPPKTLRVEAFTSQRDGPNRVPWIQLGQNMIQFIGNVMSNQMIAQLVAPDDVIKLLNQGLEAIGLPRGFRLKPPQMATPTTTQQLHQALGEFSEQIKQYITQEQSQALTDLFEKMKKYVDSEQKKLLSDLARGADAIQAAGG